MEEMNFDTLGLSVKILKAIKGLGFEKATEVQSQVIPLALQYKDMIVKSQTGSGKTAAFGIPVCEAVNIEEKEAQVLILTPTRELCMQVKNDISNLGRFKRIRCAAIFGKQPFEGQVKELKQRVHIVVGTPGRTADHIQRGSLVTSNIKYLIIDEADKMLNMGFIDQVEGIIKTLKVERATWLFSATMPSEITQLCEKYMNNPMNIEVTSKNTIVNKVNQCYYEVLEKDKNDLLKRILYIENPESCIIFCNTKDKVDKLSRYMKDKGYSCNSLHGGMLQKDRLNIMESFKQGEFDVLVATDVAARGIDIENLTHIVNYDLPEEKESYVHRIGRTGRAEKTGKAITFVCPNEKGFLSEIEEYIKHEIDRRLPPTKAEIENAKKNNTDKCKKTLILKPKKGANLEKDITKIYIGAGKNKKIRAGDIVGAITSIEGVKAENIGIINIQDNFSYIDILDGMGSIVLEGLKTSTIKGKTVRVEMAAK
jgi:superfamily II DNA/RNA helicase